MTRRMLTGTIILLALAGGVVSAQTPVKRQAVETGTRITVGESVFEFDPAEDPPAGACVVEVTITYGQQDTITAVVAHGFVWVQQGETFAVGAEWGPVNVTDLAGWAAAKPDDCDGVTFGGT